MCVVNWPCSGPLTRSHELLFGNELLLGEIEESEAITGLVLNVHHSASANRTAVAGREPLCTHDLFGGTGRRGRRGCWRGSNGRGSLGLLSKAGQVPNYNKEGQISFEFAEVDPQEQAKKKSKFQHTWTMTNVSRIR